MVKRSIKGVSIEINFTVEIYIFKILLIKNKYNFD